MFVCFLTYRCECHEGFTAAYDGVSCMDINECELNQHECDQRCNNIIGELNIIGISFKKSYEANL